MSLGHALRVLEARGLRLVFSDRVVRPGMRLESEPVVSSPRRMLEEILRPHGLEAREGPGGVLVIVPAPRPERPAPEPVGELDEGGVAADPGGLPTTSEAIEVRSEPRGMLGEEISALDLDRLRLRSLPAIAGDPVRSVGQLPGATRNDVSAEIHVRGSHSDQVMIRLDGLEIPEPYHLRDFNNALSILPPAAVGGARLLTGGFPVEYGDRSGGVLDLTSREPGPEGRFEAGLSPYHAELLAAGSLAGERGSWLATARAGSLKLAARVAELDQEPEFADLFGKVVLELSPAQILVGHALASQDRLRSSEPDVPDQGAVEEVQVGEGQAPPGSMERFDTRYGNRYGWLTHGVQVGRSSYLESRISLTEIHRDRNGFEAGSAGGHFELLDERRTFMAGLEHEGEVRLSRHHEAKWGAEVRWLEVNYDYASDFELTGPFAALRDRPAAGATRFRDRLHGRQYGLYLADRFRPASSLLLEAGVRFDENTLLDDEFASPRLSLDFRPVPATALRLAWGVFHQTQRVYELQVEDGVTTFFPAERAEHRILGLEHTFRSWTPSGGGGRGDSLPPTLRVELYERRISDPRPRWENLFDPVSLTPELEPDRVRIAPVSGRARGAEVLVSGSPGAGLRGLVSYAWAEVEDRIGGRDVPRSIDQTHTAQLQLSWRTPWRWDVDVAWTWHTGWPTTEVSVERTADGNRVPVLGPLYGERLPDYRRWDLGARRSFRLPRGELELSLQVQNLSGTRNLRGFEVSLEEAEDTGGVRVVKTPEDWGPPIPSVGVRWSF